MAQQPLPPHLLGYEANDIASRNMQLREQISQTRDKISAFLEEFGRIININSLAKHISTLAVPGILLVAFWEYRMSFEMYIEFVGERFQWIPPLVIICLATLLSFLIGLPIYRNLGIIEKPPAQLPDLVNRHQKRIPRDWYFAGLGVVFTFLITKYLIYNVAAHRVELMKEAGMAINEVEQVILPVGLYLIEILLGIFVIIAWVRANSFMKSKYLNGRLRWLEHKEYRQQRQALETWDIYVRELNQYNQKYNAREEFVAASLDLRTLAEEYYGDVAQGRTLAGDEKTESNEQENVPPQTEQAESGTVPASQSATVEYSPANESGEQDLIKLLDEMNQRNNGEIS